MKKLFVVLLATCCIFSGCSNINTLDTQTQETSEQITSITFTDSFGYTVSIDNPQNVAVLSGSYADAWLLAGGELALTTEDARYYWAG